MIHCDSTRDLSLKAGLFDSELTTMFILHFVYCIARLGFVLCETYYIDLCTYFLSFFISHWKTYNCVASQMCIVVSVWKQQFQARRTRSRLMSIRGKSPGGKPTFGIDLVFTIILIKQQHIPFHILFIYL